ncbi:hypothetical protein G7Y79_00047g083010 [Physcia stellaris]|nr:hypothetical protein G7Y79_00047g083010 [Physcia stellaris]
MSLQITIHNPQRYYTANSPISGTVHLVGKSDIDVSQILIAFSGRCKSKLVISRGTGKDKKRDYYRGRVPIFHYETILFTGPRTLHPNQHSWDFSFRFPPRCHSRGGDQFHGPSYNFNDDPHQALPPSYDLPRQGLSKEVSGYVSYEIEARLVKDGSKFFGSGGSETVERLLVKGQRDVAEPDPQPYTLAKAIECKSMHLLPGYEDRSLTLIEKLHSVRSKNLPAAFFQIDLRIPRVAVMGWGLPMFLTLDHDLERSANKNPPTVYLKQVKVSLETLGTIRCLNDGALRSKTEDKVEAYEQRIIIGEFNSAKNPQPITERIDLRKLMNLHLDAQFISPGFQRSTSKCTML